MSQILINTVNSVNKLTKENYMKHKSLQMLIIESEIKIQSKLNASLKNSSLLNYAKPKITIVIQELEKIKNSKS